MWSMELFRSRQTLLEGQALQLLLGYSDLQFLSFLTDDCASHRAPHKVVFSCCVYRLSNKLIIVFTPFVFVSDGVWLYRHTRFLVYSSFVPAL